MRSVQSARRLAAILLPLFGAMAAGPAGAAPRGAPAQAAPQPQQQPAAQPAGGFVDGIAAVVDKDVITLRELRMRTGQIREELARQNIEPPEDAILQRQVLQRLITERVEDREAARLNVRVTDEQVEQTIQSIAQRNNVPVEQMRKQIEQRTTWDEYRRVLRRDMMHDRMRQRVIDHTIVITDGEVNAFLKEQQAQRGISSLAGQRPAAHAGQPEVLVLAQILVRVPEGSSPDQVASLRRKAEELLKRARGGADFAALAAAASDGPEALEGGMMGARPVDGWPDLFLKAVGSASAGQVSDIVQSGNGFHILKVVDRQGPQAQQRAAAGHPGAQQPPAQQGPMHVTQTHARHILIKTSAVMSDDQARQRLEQLRQRILQGGENFGDLARRFSADSTASKGGDLGWLNPGETVPAFETAMDALKEGEVSAPIQSPFGWHLIQVESRRVQDMADEYQRMQARQTLFERRAQPAFETWLEQLRDQAYVDNRLEKREQLERAL